jgi:CheY-like chemotaxis protein
MMQLRILAVDDEPAALELFRSVVASLGYEVVATSDGREAVERVMTEKFDLIALDVRTSHLDGFALTERIRTSRSNHAVPILMLTQDDSVETIRRGFAAGITFFMAKPLSAAKLRGLFKAARGLVVQERRRYIRLPVGLNVVCRVGGKSFRARSVNLAQGGILVQGSGGAEAGAIVEVEFTLPGAAEPLKLMGKVARKAAPEGMALEFIEPEEGERAALVRYVETQTKE